MATESNVHTKLAMADVLGCLLIAWVAFMIGMVGLEQIKLDGATTMALNWAGIGLIVVTVIAYLNENLLGTAIFGPLAFFFIAFPAMVAAGGSGPAVATAIGFFGVVLLIDGIVSLLQPVKLLPILLFVAGIGFLALAVYWSGGAKIWLNTAGALLTLVSLIAGYLGFAITLMVVKGKPVVPMLIKAGPASG